VRIAIGRTIFVLAASAACASAQWEVGVAGGYSAPRTIPVTAPAGSGTVGFAPGTAFSAWVGQDVKRYLGGEVRYSYIMGDARVQSGGATTTFPAASHVLEYDLMLHTSNRGPVQIFLAAGGGVRIFDWTSQTAPRTSKPMGSVGYGLKFRLAKGVTFRLETRDYITPFPTEAIPPGLGITFGRTITHDFVPMAGFGFGK